MKNLYSFSENPLNTEKFVFLSGRANPETRTAAPSTNESNKLASTTEVAKTMMKLATLLTAIDDKIAHAEEKFKVYRNSELYDKGAQKDPQKKAFYTRKRKEWYSKLKAYKRIKDKIHTTNDKFKNIDAIRNREYGKVKLKTLTAINKEMDENARDSGVDLRQDALKDMMKIAFQRLIKDKTANLSILTGLFSMMNNGDKPLDHDGLKISKKGDKITIKYKDSVQTYTIKAAGKDMKWEIRGNGDLKVQKKVKTTAVSGLFENEGGPNVLSGMLHSYYKPKSAESYFKGVQKTIAAKKAKLQPKVAKKPVKPAPKITEAKRTKPAKVKVLGQQPKPKRTAKVAPTTRRGNIATPGSSKETYKDLKKFERKGEVKESPATIAATNEWGKTLARDIGMFTSALLSRITVYKGWVKSGKTMKQYQAFKRSMAGVGKEVKKADGVDKVRAANKLAKVYKDYLVGLPVELKDKLKVKISEPPKNNAKVALHRSVFPVVPEGTPASKVMVAKKKPSKKPTKLSMLKKIAYAKPKAKPKQIARGKLKVEGSKQTQKLVEKYSVKRKVYENASKLVNGLESGKSIDVKELAQTIHSSLSEIALVTGAKIRDIVLRSKSGKMRMVISNSNGNTTITVEKSGVKHIIARTEGSRFKIDGQQLAKLQGKAKPKEAIAAKEGKERAPGLSKWASQNEKVLRNIRKEFIVDNDQALYKMYGENNSAVLIRLNTLNRALKNPKITFTEAAKVCKSLRRGFRDLQKRAKEKKVAFVRKDTKKNISYMTTLKFPPAPTNPTVAEKKLITKENRRLAQIKAHTKDIKVS